MAQGSDVQMGVLPGDVHQSESFLWRFFVFTLLYVTLLECKNVISPWKQKMFKIKIQKRKAFMSAVVLIADTGMIGGNYKVLMSHATGNGEWNILSHSGPLLWGHDGGRLGAQRCLVYLPPHRT